MAEHSECCYQTLTKEAVSSSLLQKAWIYSISTREGLDRETGAMVLQLACRVKIATSPWSLRKSIVRISWMA